MRRSSDKKRHRRIPRFGRIILACMPVAMLFTASASAGTPASWSAAADGYWTDASKWSSKPNYPNNGTPAGSTYDVTIGKPYTVTLDQNVAVNSLMLSGGAILSQTNGTLTLTGNLAIQSGQYRLADAIISGGRLTTAGASTLVVLPTYVWTPATLDGLIVAGNVDVQDTARLVSATDLVLDAGRIRLLNQSTLELDGTITGQGQILFSGSNAASKVTPSSVSLMIDPQVTIRTGGGSGIVGAAELPTINKGLISAETPGSSITIQGDFTNQGTLQAINGGILTLNPSTNWSNTGTIHLDQGTLNIGGSDLLKNLGPFTRNGGTVNLTGGHYIDGPNALDLSSTAAGAVNLGTGAYITSGALTASAGAIQVINSDGSDGSSTLDRVQLMQDVVVNNAANLALVHDVTMNSTRISLASSGSETHLRGSEQTYLAGNGQITFDGSDAADNYVDGFLELREGITVRTGTQGGTIGSVHGYVQNNGLVSAQTPGKTITIAGAFRNDGTVEAKNGAAVAYTMSMNAANYDGAKLSGGKWRVYDGSSIDMGSAAIQVNAADVLLSGPTSSFAAMDALQENQGTLTIADGRVFKTAGPLINGGRLSIGRNSSVGVNGALSNSGIIDISGSLSVQATSDTQESVLREIVQQIVDTHGPADGLWADVGITSTAAREDTKRLTTLGTMVDSANSILIKYTWSGDANCDGIVNADDYGLIDRGFVSQKGGWYNGDFNYDTMVNADDYGLIDRAFVGQTGPLSVPSFSRSFVSSSAVPEPQLLVLLAPIGAFLAISRRARFRRDFL